jgi:hypothetical protein
VKVESLIFGIIAFFCVAAAVVYGFWAKEPIGTTALVLSAGLTGLIGGFFWFVSRRIDARPEDRKDAEIADGAGELGFFPPYSWWPLWCAAALAVIVYAVAMAAWWLVVIGFGLGGLALSGFVFEYYRGEHAH